MFVIYITPLTVYGKNSTTTCASISHGGPILSEGKEEIFVEDLMCAKHSARSKQPLRMGMGGGKGS